MRGGTNREIAVALSVSVHTVRHHVQHILSKVGIRSRTQLMETLRLHRDGIAEPRPPPEPAGAIRNSAADHDGCRKARAEEAETGTPGGGKGAPVEGKPS